jgi:hypothetical protein
MRSDFLSVATMASQIDNKHQKTDQNQNENNENSIFVNEIMTCLRDFIDRHVKSSSMKFDNYLKTVIERNERKDKKGDVVCMWTATLRALSKNVPMLVTNGVEAAQVVHTVEKDKECCTITFFGSEIASSESVVDSDIRTAGVTPDAIGQLAGHLAGQSDGESAGQSAGQLSLDEKQPTNEKVVTDRSSSHMNVQNRERVFVILCTLDQPTDLVRLFVVLPFLSNNRQFNYSPRELTVSLVIPFLRHYFDGQNGGLRKFEPQWSKSTDFEKTTDSVLFDNNTLNDDLYSLGGYRYAELGCNDAQYCTYSLFVMARLKRCANYLKQIGRANVEVFPVTEDRKDLFVCLYDTNHVPSTIFGINSDGELFLCGVCDIWGKTMKMALTDDVDTFISEILEGMKPINRKEETKPKNYLQHAAIVVGTGILAMTGFYFLVGKPKN